jgi:hypothetical protein
VSTLQSLFLLLLVAYVGGFLMGGRGVRGAGLPSGSEWLLLGIVAGPSALGIVSGSELALFAPLVLLAVGWIALLVGLTVGDDRGRRVPAGGFLLGLLVGAVNLAVVGGVAWVVVERVPSVRETFPARADRMALAVALAAALADTSRQVSRWASERLGARGPVRDRIADVTRSDDLVPVLALSALVSIDTSRGVRTLPLLGFGLGAVLGAAAAGLLGRAPRVTAIWGLVFGFSLLATGVAEQLDVNVLAAGLGVGIGLALLSPARDRVRELAAGAVGAVVLPALFLAGARTGVVTGPAAWILLSALGARLAGSVLSAGLVAAVDPRLRRAGPALLLAFFPTGPLGIAIALAVNLRYPGTVGDLVLATAVVTALAGEFLGPPSLRAILRRTGELPAATAEGATPGLPVPAEDHP